MFGLWTEILWQFERRRKYTRWSCGTNRARTVTVVAKAVTLILALGLFYISVISSLGGTTDNAKLNILTKPASYPLRKEISSFGHHFLKSNGLEDSNESKNVRIIAAAIINRLARNFHKADRNANGLLDEEELTLYINNAIAMHFENAMKDNFDHYFNIDNNPKNGLVSWEEYLSFFFQTKSISGITADDVNNRTPPFMALSKDIKVAIARVQASWSEAASNDPEFLTVDEFLAFEHPEASPTKIIANVEDLLTTFDLDGDGKITDEEFESTYKHAEGVDPIYKHDKHVIDADGNGEISRIELMRYMDPRSLHHSRRDAKELIKISDNDKNGRLSLLELVHCANKVVKSKFYDVDTNLHEH